MKNESKIILSALTAIGAAGYIGYLHSKINKISALIEVAVDDLSSNTEVTISQDILDLALQKAVDREVSYISAKISRDVDKEIRSQIKYSVEEASSDIKDSVSTELAKQVKNIDISGMEREVIRKAKDAVAEKFDRKLDGILDDFNGNLENVQKIYSSIAKSMAKD